MADFLKARAQNATTAPRRAAAKNEIPLSNYSLR
jgi:hypothetical protein